MRYEIEKVSQLIYDCQFKRRKIVMKKTTMIAVVVSVLMIGGILFGVAQTRSGD